MTSSKSTPVIVLGGGLAGLTVALRLADAGREVLMLAKRQLSEGSSHYAQGGIAAVLDEDDSIESHVEDTLRAGAGLCNEASVRFVVEESGNSIQWLIDQGVKFTLKGKDDCDGSKSELSPYHLTREGGHSVRRVIHADDATGRAVIQTLEARARSHERIKILEQHIAVDIVTSAKLNLPGTNRCLGLYALNKATSHVVTLPATTVVLATGGASKVYLYTSNPDTSTGDGIAMAWRAGCRVSNMEFVQFHPTCLYHPQAKSFLLSEALRGEGALLRLPDGTRFMPDHDDRAELAPRDIVARAIDYEMKRGGFESVYLDISDKPAKFIYEHFPNISQRCADLGFDLTTKPVPVVPAAHYTCGGVLTDLEGRTDVEGLYAVGEVSTTGLHGANRLASNSLLECLTFAISSSANILADQASEPDEVDLPPWDESQVSDADEQIVVTHNWDEIRRTMWDYVGIVRTSKRLERASHRVRLLQSEIRDYYRNFRIDNNLIELRNLVVVADLIIRSALDRKESRGLHYTLDYPETLPDAEAVDTVLVPDNYVGPQN